MNTERIFRPPLKRLMLSKVLFLVLPMVLGNFVRQFIDVLKGRPFDWIDLQTTLFGALIGMLIYISLWVGLNLDWFTIKIGENEISGPTAWGGRQSILRSQIDRARTLEQNWLQRLGRERGIWDTQGNRFTLDEWNFSPEQVAEILAMIGCE